MFILTIIKIFLITLYFRQPSRHEYAALSFRISVQSYEVSDGYPNFFTFFKNLDMRKPTLFVGIFDKYLLQIDHSNACSTKLNMLVAEVADIRYRG